MVFHGEHIFDFDIKRRDIYIASGHLMMDEETSSILKMSELNGEIDATFMKIGGHAYAVIIQGDYIYTGSTDKIIRKFDLEQGTMITEYVAHSEAISALAVTENFLFSGSHDGLVKKWNLNGDLLATYVANGAKVNQVITKDDYIFAGTDDDKIYMWSITNQSIIHFFEGHSMAVNDLAICDNYLYSVSNDRTIRQWDISTLSDSPVVIKGHSKIIRSLGVVCNKTHDIVYSGSDDLSIKKWKIDTPKNVQRSVFTTTNVVPTAGRFVENIQSSDGSIFFAIAVVGTIGLLVAFTVFKKRKENHIESYALTEKHRDTFYSLSSDNEEEV